MEHLCWSLFLMKLVPFRSATLLERDSTQVFYYHFCESFNNTYFEEHLRTAASVYSNDLLNNFKDKLQRKICKEKSGAVKKVN